MNESAPSALYRQHHQVEAPRVDDRHFRPHWRIITRLDGLLADRAITAAEWHAAADYRDLVDQFHRRTLARPAAMGTGTMLGVGSNVVERIVDNLDAGARLVQIRTALGAVACALLDAALVRDLSWAELGRELCRDPKTARAWVIAAIKALGTV
jgi:hypothetical protein